MNKRYKKYIHHNYNIHLTGCKLNIELVHEHIAKERLASIRPSEIEKHNQFIQVKHASGLQPIYKIGFSKRQTKAMNGIINLPLIQPNSRKPLSHIISTLKSNLPVNKFLWGKTATE